MLPSLSVDRFVMATVDVPEPDVPEFVASESWLLEVAGEAAFEVPVVVPDAVLVPVVTAEPVPVPDTSVNT